MPHVPLSVGRDHGTPHAAFLQRCQQLAHTLEGMHGVLDTEVWLAIRGPFVAPITPISFPINQQMKNTKERTVVDNIF